MEKYNKLIMAILGAAVTALTLWTGIEVPPEQVSGIGGTITAFLVWLVSNKTA